MRCTFASRLTLAALALGAIAMPAHALDAVDFSLSNRYGEYVDKGAYRAYIYLADNTRLDCASGVEQRREGDRIVLQVRRLPGTYVSGECSSIEAGLGELGPGAHEIEVRALAVAGASHDAKVRTITVAPIAGRCNADPELQPAVHVVADPRSGMEVLSRIASDPDYAATFGHPVIQSSSGLGYWLTFPPLVDPTHMAYRLDQTGGFTGISRNAWLCGTPPPSVIADVVEFHHPGLDQYFYSGDTGELAAVDAGKVGPRTRTGRSFRVYAYVPGCTRGGALTPVYRFFGTPGKGPNSHFFTRDRAECHAADASGQWGFEGLPFYAAAPGADGTCAGNGKPLHRVWRPFGDSNHRFSTDPAVVQAMVAKGWIHEGAVMCVLASPA